jgi:hypothetical protein
LEAVGYDHGGLRAGKDKAVEVAVKAQPLKRCRDKDVAENAIVCANQRS